MLDLSSGPAGRLAARAALSSRPSSSLLDSVASALASVAGLVLGRPSMTPLLLAEAASLGRCSMILVLLAAAAFQGLRSAAEHLAALRFGLSSPWLALPSSAGCL